MLIGLNIKHLRYLFGLTTRQMADRIGTSNGTVSRYENGDSEPTFDTVERIAAAFDIPVEVFARENFKEKWASLAEFEKWLGENKRQSLLESKITPSVELLLAIVNSNNIQTARIIALKRHYIQSISKGDSTVEQRIREELEVIEKEVLRGLTDPKKAVDEALKILEAE